MKSAMKKKRQIARTLYRKKAYTPFEATVKLLVCRLQVSSSPSAKIKQKKGHILLPVGVNDLRSVGI